MSKKKRISTAIVTVLVVALICPFALRAGLTETLGFSSGSSLSSLSSFITFFNAKDDKTALYVKKEVESPDPDDPAPADDEFEFILSKTTGGVTEPAPGVEYYLQDEKGRIYIYDGVQTHTEDKTKFEDRTAQTTAKSQAGSTIRSPPAMFRKTSFMFSLNPARFSRTASNILRRRTSKPVAERWAVP